MEMYLTALLAPAQITQQVMKWKLWMQEKYRCEVALRSPAHITLVPPFWMKPELEDELTSSIREFSSIQNPFLIMLQDFSCFKPGVLFIDVEKNEMLGNLKNSLESFLLQKKRFGTPKEDRKFHPHVTIATRDLRKKDFYEAWSHFEKLKYSAQWFVDNISVLKHNKKNWDVLFTSQFQSV